jgi:hypothetical protein
MTHLAYNAATGEVLTTNRANYLKRWVARHTANDLAWGKANGVTIAHKWVFAHGGTYTECIAKLTARHTWG